MTVASQPLPYSALAEVLPYRMHGWRCHESVLARLIDELEARSIVEVGTWLGRTALYVGKLVASRGGRVYCVDTWSGSEYLDGNLETRELVGTCYEQFLSNVVHEGLCEVIVPVRGRSVGVAAAWDGLGHGPADLVYVDAAHEGDEPYEDCRAWWRHVRLGGVLSGDDYDDGNVRGCVDRFAAESGLVVESAESFWYARKPGS